MTGDPRPSLVARYGSHAAFIEQARLAADKAVATHLLLAEDSGPVVAARCALYDRIMTHEPEDISCGYMRPFSFN